MNADIVYTAVTERVLTSLRDGVPPWRKPWGDEGFGLPVNAKTKKPYQGINVMLLWLANQGSPHWATEKVWLELGATILPDESPTDVYFFTFFQGKSNKRIPYICNYRLYNLHQVRGCNGMRRKPARTGDFAPAESLIRNTKAVIVDGKEACYDMETDIICCPPCAMFSSVIGYVTTRLHELAHWTGHRSRLKRVFGLNRKSPEYAFEELVAELTSCFLAAALEVPQALDEMPNHASYLAAWLRVLGEDQRAIFRAAALAQRAVKYLLSFNT